MKSKCIRKGCVRDSGLVYLGKFMCWFHWDQMCARKDRSLDPEKLDSYVEVS